MTAITRPWIYSLLIAPYVRHPVPCSSHLLPPVSLLGAERHEAPASAAVGENGPSRLGRRARFHGARRASRSLRRRGEAGCGDQKHLRQPEGRRRLHVRPGRRRLCSLRQRPVDPSSRRRRRVQVSSDPCSAPLVPICVVRVQLVLFRLQSMDGWISTQERERF